MWMCVYVCMQHHVCNFSKVFRILEKIANAYELLYWYISYKNKEYYVTNCYNFWRR